MDGVILYRICVGFLLVVTLMAIIVRLWIKSFPSARDYLPMSSSSASSYHASLQRTLVSHAAAQGAGSSPRRPSSHRGGTPPIGDAGGESSNSVRSETTLRHISVGGGGGGATDNCHRAVVYTIAEPHPSSEEPHSDYDGDGDDDNNHVAKNVEDHSSDRSAKDDRTATASNGSVAEADLFSAHVQTAVTAVAAKAAEEPPLLLSASSSSSTSGGNNDALSSAQPRDPANRNIGGGSGGGGGDRDLGFKTRATVHTAAELSQLYGARNEGPAGANQQHQQLSQQQQQQQPQSSHAPEAKYAPSSNESQARLHDVYDSDGDDMAGLEEDEKEEPETKASKNAAPNSIVIDYADMRRAIGARPKAPAEEDCCGEGCANCVMDVYDTRLQRWKQRRTRYIKEKEQEKEKEKEERRKMDMSSSSQTPG